jgi:hypothetical protein
MDLVASQYSWHHSSIIKWTIKLKLSPLGNGPAILAKTRVGHSFFKSAADFFFAKFKEAVEGGIAERGDGSSHCISPLRSTRYISLATHLPPGHADFDRLPERVHCGFLMIAAVARLR